jgi:hypothetical protein
MDAALEPAMVMKDAFPAGRAVPRHGSTRRIRIRLPKKIHARQKTKGDTQ